MRMAKIQLSGLRARGTHGVLDFEHAQPQEFVVDLKIHLDISRALQTDRIEDTISYAEVADVVVKVIEGEHCDLIETLADRIAARVHDLGATAVEVTLHKPHAPMDHEFADVSVTVETWGPSLDPDPLAVIAIGSNLDDPADHVRRAIDEVGAIADLIAISGLYRTAPVLAEGQSEQPDYINAVVMAATTLSPEELLAKLQKIENDHGRVREERWGPRTLDLDIITFGDVTSDDEGLTLPHPRAAERRFVLEPWLAIDPDAELAGQPVATLLAGLEEQQIELVEGP